MRDGVGIGGRYSTYGGIKRRAASNVEINPRAHSPFTSSHSCKRLLTEGDTASKLSRTGCTATLAAPSVCFADSMASSRLVLRVFTRTYLGHDEVETEECVAEELAEATALFVASLPFASRCARASRNAFSC